MNAIWRRSARRGRWLVPAGRRERGAAALEFAGVFPLVVLAALVALQFGVAGWTLVSTQQAARNAARAASLHQDPAEAARQTLPGSLRATSVTGGPSPDGHRYTVTVKVPSLLKIDLGEVSRTVDMPEVRS